MVFLETQRLTLRNVAPRDTDVMFDYRNHEACARYQRGQTKDYAGIRELIEKRKGDLLSTENPALIAVSLRDTDELIGEIVVMPNEDTFSLGYTFSYRHHRRGYAFEALSALTELLHGRYPIWEFISFTHPDNQASRGLLLKLGYRDLGYIPSMESQAFGKWITQVTEEELAQIRR